jgi:predicted N-acyltransferase
MTFERLVADSRTFRIVRSGSIADFAPNEWSSLAPASPFVSHGWLSAIEETAIRKPDLLYIAVYGDDELIGAVVAEHIAPSKRSGTLNGIMLGRIGSLAARFGLGFEPALICSSFDAGAPTFLIHRDATPSERVRISRILIDTLCESAAADRLRLAICGVEDVSGEIATTCSNLNLHKSALFPAASLVPEWKSFDDYVAAIAKRSKSAAKDIRRERNRLRKSDTTIDRFTPGPRDDQRLRELAESNYIKYGLGAFPYAESFFSTLSKKMQDDAVFFGAWKSDLLVAFSLLVKCGKDAWGAYYGSDFEACGNDHTYFNVVFNKPIEYAIDAKLARLNYGPGLLDLKLRRGCELTPLHVYYRSLGSTRWLLGRGLALRTRYIVNKSEATRRAEEMRRRGKP